MYCGVVHHVGRRSSTRYATPVVVKLTSGGAVVPLPHGAATDGCRNILEAGGCTVTLNGSELAFTAPELISAGAAAPLVPAATAHVWRRIGINQYLRLSLATPAPVRPDVASRQPRSDGPYHLWPTSWLSRSQVNWLHQS
jgi:hypothetical protein